MYTLFVWHILNRWLTAYIWRQKCIWTIMSTPFWKRWKKIVTQDYWSAIIKHGMSTVRESTTCIGYICKLLQGHNLYLLSYIQYISHSISKYFLINIWAKGILKLQLWVTAIQSLVTLIIYISIKIDVFIFIHVFLYL